MKIINMTKGNFNLLEKFELDKSIFNTESQIFSYKYRGKEYLFKKLYKVKGKTLANKLYTIEMLNYYRKYLPDSFCIPDSLIAINGDVVGFTISKFIGENFGIVLNNPDVSVKTKLFYLHQIGDVLKQMKYIRKYTPVTTLFINDLHEGNILVNLKNKKICFVDLDSCRILSKNCFRSRYLRNCDLLINKGDKYTYNFDSNKGDSGIIPNENTDLFCYNAMIFNYLSKYNIVRMKEDEFYVYLNYLNDLNIDKGLLDSFNKLALGCDNENPCDYLENLTDSQVYRSDINIYRKVMNK